MGFVHEEPGNFPEKLPALRVLRRSGMTTDFEALDSGHRRFIGVKMTHDIGPDGKPGKHHGKFATTDLVEELPFRREYLQAIAEGHLYAVDEQTAKAAMPYAGTTQGDYWRRWLAPRELVAKAEELLKSTADQVKKNEDAVKGPLPTSQGANILVQKA